MRRLAVAAQLLAATYALRDPHHLKVTFRAHNADFGLFFTGNMDTPCGKTIESHRGILHAGQTITQAAYSGDTFTLRSSDMRFRAHITGEVNEDPNKDDYPYRIKVSNHMTEGGLIELKSSETSYAWISPRNFSHRYTSSTHPFELRDRDHNPMFAVSIDDVRREL
eukprot:gnl/TRDRNA2_/TRDRNA2_159648_c0_seq1.p1 gnl/TRDRNA2_/TRDRNA2_159648_c0~~gnl/TRDRNA2_/TRDRNA2_159648_c0_seq1.p1  ORF type:complete len:166 (+),score=18.81 gnl/TRDRNA2_/TRDRNA2_159648_c0_seq1:51-548(+)